MAPSKVSHNSTATVTAGKNGCTPAPPIPAKPDILDRFREPKMCEFPTTSEQVKPDPFTVLRPEPRTVLDYHISQTDIKGQRKQSIGITKLHLQQTSARYDLPPPGYTFPLGASPPAPPVEPKIKYSTGRGPLKEFLEDKWRRKVEKQQIAAKKHLAKFIVETRRYEKEQLATEHAKLMKLIGPDWFQELCPQQLRTVDNLKNCIVKDVKLKTTCNTEINMAELGLVLRPNPRHIKIALKKCCECPVEFLLILYQLLNKHRTDYSLNDRLLLSAVVHLTMRETLKELHIRIPSPPPPLKKEIQIKSEKPKRYKSPYLVPFTFKPEKAKHTGIYKNNHMQYPESPYFSYISELKNEIRKAEIKEVDEESSEGGEENTEKRKSKKKKRVNSKKSTKIMITKKQSGITDAQEKELVGELRVAQREYNSLVDYEPVPFLRKASIYIPCDYSMKKKNVDAEEEESSETETNATISVEVKVTTDFDACYQPIRKVCECRITFDETKVRKHPLEDSSSSSVSLVCDCGVVDKADLPSKGEIEKKTIAVSTASRAEVKHDNVIEKSTTMQDVKTPEKEPDSAAKRESKPSSAKSLPSIGKVADEKLITVGNRESSDCKCKEGVENQLEANLCKCDRCKADRAGRKPCDCLQKYQDKVKMYEDMKTRFDAQHNLKSADQQYIIGGATNSHEGEPVYVLSGVIPQRESSAQAHQKGLTEEERQASMEAAGAEECLCMKMYKSYANKHLPCLKMYENYLKKVELDTQEYMAEVSQDPRFADLDEIPSASHSQDVAATRDVEVPTTAAELKPSKHSAISEENDRKVSEGFELGHFDTQPKSQEESKAVPQSEEVCRCGVVEEIDDCACGITETTFGLTLEINKEKDKKRTVCICDPERIGCVCTMVDPIECECGAESSESEESDEPDMTRFIILDAIPCQAAKQIQIIKKALEVLANDGYPLAKLPDSYKLPHFKLWMQLRCGKFWTQEQRVPFHMASLGHWRHYGYCGRKVRLPKLNLSPEETRKYTWAHAKLVRGMAMEADVGFYRKIRQANIGDGREFFPSTFSYQFPTPNFRDCYFAYTAAKEENCVCWRPWYARDVKPTKKKC